MADIVDKTTRSRMMASIRGRDTKPEILVRRYLFANGFRFRLHYVGLPGRPDIVLPKYKMAIFVHGCFWHRHHGCRFSTIPKENGEKWKLKFRENIERDKRQIAEVGEKGWRVVVIWECSFKPPSHDISWLSDHIRSGTATFLEWPEKSAL